MANKINAQGLAEYWLGEAGPLQSFNTERLELDENSVISSVVTGNRRKQLFKDNTLWMLDTYTTKANAKRLWPTGWASMTVKQLSESLIP